MLAMIIARDGSSDVGPKYNRFFKSKCFEYFMMYDTVQCIVRKCPIGGYKLSVASQQALLHSRLVVFYLLRMF